MNYYVKIPSINGRKEFSELAMLFAEHGLDADYCNGEVGEVGKCPTYPHLRFNRQADALVFILMEGGEILSNPPYKEKFDPWEK